MIPEDDKLYQLLAEIGADYGLYVIHQNPLADPEVAVLYKWGLVEYKQTDNVEWHFTLTVAGRAWLDAATQVPAAEKLLQAYKNVSPPDDNLLLRPYF